jgi:hypothetical protein
MSYAVIIGEQSFTDRYESLTFSNVDPGGYEAATITVRDDSGVSPGQTVWIRKGMEVVFFGRVNEPGPHTEAGKGSRQITALGAGVVLKDERMTELYAHAAMSDWQQATTRRQISLRSSSYDSHGTETTHDPNGTKPALRARMTSHWVAGHKPMVEAWFDARGVALGSVYYEYEHDASINSGVDANWKAYVVLATDDLQSAYDVSADLADATTSGSGTFSATTATRTWAQLQFYYDAASSGGDGISYDWFWKNIRLFGNHGLTKRGSDPKGYYPADIARDAAERVGGFGAYVVDTDPNSYILTHAVYLDPVTHEKVIDDMAKYLGWHWGVWGPVGIQDDLPTFYFTAPPEDATCWISVRDGDLDPPKVRLDSLYDTCKVTYQDETGKARTVTCTLANPLLAAAGLSGRTLDLNVGVSTSARATDQGNIALALAQTAQRGSGSVVLTGPIGGSGFVRKDPATLKAGRDRLRIVDLPDAGRVSEADTRRYDIFHIRRVETSVQRGQTPSTRVEFDGGADLLEVMQARFAVAAIVAA